VACFAFRRRALKGVHRGRHVVGTGRGKRKLCDADDVAGNGRQCRGDAGRLGDQADVGTGRKAETVGQWLPHHDRTGGAPGGGPRPRTLVQTPATPSLTPTRVTLTGRVCAGSCIRPGCSRIETTRCTSGSDATSRTTLAESAIGKRSVRPPPPTIRTS